MNFQTVKEVETHAKQRMEKVLEGLTHEMASIRTGRASVSLLDGVRVEAYGSVMSIRELATLHVPEPAMITIQPFDNSQIGAIERGIRAAELGLNPSNDGKLIRVPIPPLNEERRREIVKKLHSIAEEHRVALRNARRDANDALKKMLKDKAISEDDERRALDEVQKMTDAHMAKLETAAKSKEKDIMEVK